MQIKIFNIPVPGSEKMNDEMNRFLRSKKVLHTENHLVNNGSGTFWCFCIKYLDEAPKSSRQKVDYRQTLDQKSFQRFAEMRKIRKKLAQDEGIPAYAIFTDGEMAELARLDELTATNMQDVKGIGEKKIEKYGKYFLTVKKNEKSE